MKTTLREFLTLSVDVASTRRCPWFFVCTAGVLGLPLLARGQQLPAASTLPLPVTIRSTVTEDNARGHSQATNSPAAHGVPAHAGTHPFVPSRRQVRVTYSTDGHRFVYEEEPVGASPSPFEGEHPGLLKVVFDGTNTFEFRFDGRQVTIRPGMDAHATEYFPLPGVGVWPTAPFMPLSPGDAAAALRRRLEKGRIACDVPIRNGGDGGKPFGYLAGSASFEHAGGVIVARDLQGICPGLLMQTWSFGKRTTFGGVPIAKDVEWRRYVDPVVTLSEIDSGKQLPRQEIAVSRHFVIESIKRKGPEPTSFDCIQEIASGAIVVDDRFPSSGRIAYKYDPSKTLEVQAQAARDRTIKARPQARSAARGVTMPIAIGFFLVGFAVWLWAGTRAATSKGARGTPE